MPSRNLPFNDQIGNIAAAIISLHFPSTWTLFPTSNGSRGVVRVLIGLPEGRVVGDVARRQYGCARLRNQSLVLLSRLRRDGRLGPRKPGRCITATLNCHRYEGAVTGRQVGSVHST
jgi:hypothetical protein